MNNLLVLYGSYRSDRSGIRVITHPLAKRALA